MILSRVHCTLKCFYVSLCGCYHCLDAIGEEDLVVLLSERAALEIYKKWLDTLHVSQRCPVAIHIRIHVQISLHTVFFSLCRLNG